MNGLKSTDRIIYTDVATIFRQSVLSQNQAATHQLAQKLLINCSLEQLEDLKRQAGTIMSHDPIKPSIDLFINTIVQDKKNQMDLEKVNLFVSCNDFEGAFTAACAIPIQNPLRYIAFLPSAHHYLMCADLIKAKQVIDAMPECTDKTQLINQLAIAKRPKMDYAKMVKALKNLITELNFEEGSSKLGTVLRHYSSEELNTLKEASKRCETSQPIPRQYTQGYDIAKLTSNPEALTYESLANAILDKIIAFVSQQTVLKEINKDLASDDAEAALNKANNMLTLGLRSKDPNSYMTVQAFQAIISYFMSKGDREKATRVIKEMPEFEGKTHIIELFNQLNPGNKLREARRPERSNTSSAMVQSQQLMNHILNNNVQVEITDFPSAIEQAYHEGQTELLTALLHHADILTIYRYLGFTGLVKILLSKFFA